MLFLTNIVFRSVFKYSKFCGGSTRIIDFSKRLKYRFSFGKSFLLIVISLIREKKSHNVIKANLSLIQFCNLINNSNFSEKNLPS